MITFNAQLHQYSEDGVVLPSVSQVLRTAGLIDTRWQIPAAAAFGCRVHEATAAFDRGEKLFRDFDSSIGPYLVGWWMFRETQAMRVLEIEKIIGSISLGYAGTLDRLVEMDGERWVVDLKTGSSRPWHRLQLAAYAMAVGLPCRRMAVYLEGSCGARSREYSSSSDFEEFLAALQLVKEAA